MEHEHLSTDLHNKGLRVTVPRALIWQILSESKEHFTVESLWNRVRREIPAVDLSTVYRVIDAFAQAQLVVETTLPDGAKVVEARVAFHPHLMCDQCGTLYHLPPEVDSTIRRVIENTVEGFQLHTLHVVGGGICPRCAAATALSAPATSET